MPIGQFKRSRLILAQSKPSERLIIATNQTAIKVSYEWHYTFAGSYQDLVHLADHISTKVPRSSRRMSIFIKDMAPIVGVLNSDDFTIYSACYDSDENLNSHFPTNLPLDRYRAPRARNARQMHAHDADILLAYINLCRQQRQIDLAKN